MAWIFNVLPVLEPPDLDAQVEDERKQEDDDEGQSDYRRVAGLLKPKTNKLAWLCCGSSLVKQMDSYSTGCTGSGFDCWQMK